jgi:peptidoglycan/LPS O-acetylase OafA/YrhL
LFKPTPRSSDVASQPISQSTALIILFMLIGISAFLWYAGYLRSRAGLLTIALIAAGLAYFAFWTNPVTSP